MSDFGIICEMNPLHRGHQYLLDRAGELGADRIVCVMSGNTVQRGELAVTDKYRRAEALVRSGADLVLELPFPWCSAAAESFARGGIHVLRHFCDTVLFGSECGDADALARAAELASDEKFREEYHRRLREGTPAAEAYFGMLCDRGAGTLSSNDLLGLEYLRAAKELGAPLRFLTVKRQGAAYTETDLSDCSDCSAGDYPSAMGIRRLWREGAFDAGASLLPEASAEVFRRAFAEGATPDGERLSAIWLTWFRLHEGRDFDGLAGTEGGLANRICAAARSARTAEELLEGIRTKRYTDGHLRRVMLYCLSGTRPEDLAAAPAYTTLLAANERGRALLAEARKRESMRVVTKPSDAPRDTRQYALTEKIDGMYALSLRNPQAADVYVKTTPYIGRVVEEESKSVKK